MERAGLKRARALIAAGLAVWAGAAAARDLAFGTGIPITSMDPHFHNASANNAALTHVFDRLIMRGPALEPQPSLALSWQPVAETVWEMKLRPGVKWQDGQPFTADDVAFTIARVPNVPNSPGGFGNFVRAITRVEVVDPLTVRLHTAQPAPLLPFDISAIFIVARHAVEGATTADFNSGRAAIGTGPYRLAAWRAGERLDFTRNPNWWGSPQEWDAIRYRFLLNDSARTAALLAGDVDIIDQVPSSDLPRLKGDSRVTVAEATGIQLLHLTFNLVRPDALPQASDNAGRPLPRNPLADARVRRALSVAISRDQLVARVMEGTAVARGQWMPPGGIGYNPDIPVPAYDPELARRLLAEAGYPQGFRLTLTSPSDRYPNDARLAQAIAQMWTRVGVTTQVEALPFAVFSPRTARQEFAIRLLGWGAATGESSGFSVPLLNTADAARGTGSFNHGRYSNPAFDALTHRAMLTMNDAARNALMLEATKLAMDDVAMIPLLMANNYWAMKRGIVHQPRPDTMSVFIGTMLAP